MFSVLLVILLPADPSGVYWDADKTWGIVVAPMGDGRYRTEWWSAGNEMTYFGILERTGPFGYREEWWNMTGDMHGGGTWETLGWLSCYSYRLTRADR